ncbi:MAG TPA: hypothetical protein VFW53_02705 [Gallionella sp.]|nr:hypothetical protein [Gallionella sp.]
MADAIIAAATISWVTVLLSWPIAVVVAASVCGINAAMLFKQQSYGHAWINIGGMSVVLLAGLSVMLGWDSALIAWLPSGWRPIFQIFLIMLPWLAVAIACINFLIRMRRVG